MAKAADFKLKSANKPGSVKSYMAEAESQWKAAQPGYQKQKAQEDGVKRTMKERVNAFVNGAKTGAAGGDKMLNQLQKARDNYTASGKKDATNKASATLGNKASNKGTLQSKSGITVNKNGTSQTYNGSGKGAASKKSSITKSANKTESVVQKKKKG